MDAVGGDADLFPDYESDSELTPVMLPCLTIAQETQLKAFCIETNGHQSKTKHNTLLHRIFGKKRHHPLSKTLSTFLLIWVIDEFDFTVELSDSTQIKLKKEKIENEVVEYHGKLVNEQFNVTSCVFSTLDESGNQMLVFKIDGKKLSDGDDSTTTVEENFNLECGNSKESRKVGVWNAEQYLLGEYIEDNKFSDIVGDVFQAVNMTPKYGVYEWSQKSVDRVTQVLSTVFKLRCSNVYDVKLESIFQNHRNRFPVKNVTDFKMLKPVLKELLPKITPVTRQQPRVEARSRSAL